MSKFASIDKHNVEYIIDRDNRVVVATIENTAYDIERIIEKALFGNEGYTLHLIKGANMQWKMKAVAKCCPEDEFDEKIGIEVAYKKLREKYHRKCREALTRTMFTLVSASDSLMEEYRKHDGV